jgi:GDPmannose 4,6-dehydratase
MHKVYLFTGITSQLGQALCRYIFSVSPDSYIIGTTRSLSSNVALNLQKKYKNLILTLVNPEDKPCIQRLVSLYRPDVIGNLLAQSSVGKSFLYPRETYAVNTLCNINLLESMRICSELSRATDIYRPIYFNISSAEIYGGDSISKEEKTEESTFAPSNLYGLSKASAHSAVDLYRKLYNLKCFNFVCTNFISEFQNENFVVSKILNYLVTIKQQKDKLQLGNISSVRDWMYVDDVCKAIFTCINNPSHESIGNYKIGRAHV